MKDLKRDELGAPKIADRGTFQAELDALRVREKAHTREGDAIAAARRRLPMVEVDGATPLIGERGAVTLLDTFEGRRMLIAYYFMWHTGHPAPEQCEGCTWVTSQVRELSYIHSQWSQGDGSWLATDPQNGGTEATGSRTRRFSCREHSLRAAH
jgi:predicted dithiol-disulfide oxidoreductase (DUF899 family)